MEAMKSTIPRLPNDAVLFYVHELTSRIVAKSGNPDDRFHLGKILLQGLKDAPDFVLQIDGATGEFMTCKEVLEQTIRCATAFRKLGLQRGDVIVLMSNNNLNLCIPLYAALYEGIAIAMIDMYLGVAELQDTFMIDKPKLVFCLNERTGDVEKTLSALDMEAHIVSLDEGDRNFSAFLEQYGEDTEIENFKTKDFDPKDTIAFLLATSGTTGLPKAAATTHKNAAIVYPYVWSAFRNFPTPTRLAMIFSAPQWVTAITMYLCSVMLRFTRLQSSRPMTQEHAYNLINKYREKPHERWYLCMPQRLTGRSQEFDEDTLDLITLLNRQRGTHPAFSMIPPSPTFTMMSPTMMAVLMRPGERDSCDIRCFEMIMLGGSAVHFELIQEIHKISPTTEALNVFGISETSSIVFSPEYLSAGPGKQLGCHQYRLVDTETEEDITEPNVPGELWLKGDGIFKEYYNNPSATENTFAEDRWFKTGDLFYRDEHWSYFFVERKKLLLKYKNHQISPVELETIIKRHPGVSDAVVTGVEDKECGELPVACVVRRIGFDVTAQEIKDLVKESLTESKQLRGGVIFLNELPVTPSTKVNRRKLREMAAVMTRE